MKKILKKILIGFTLLIIIITSFSAYIYIKASNYKDYPIKGDKQIFQKIGIEEVYLLRNGLISWQEESLPLVK